MVRPYRPGEMLVFVVWTTILLFIFLRHVTLCNIFIVIDEGKYPTECRIFYKSVWGRVNYYVYAETLRTFQSVVQSLSGSGPGDWTKDQPTRRGWDMTETSIQLTTGSFTNTSVRSKTTFRLTGHYTEITDLNQNKRTSLRLDRLSVDSYRSFSLNTGFDFRTEP